MNNFGKYVETCWDYNQNTRNSVVIFMNGTVVLENDILKRSSSYYKAKINFSITQKIEN